MDIKSSKKTPVTSSSKIWKFYLPVRSGTPSREVNWYRIFENDIHLSHLTVRFGTPSREEYLYQDFEKDTSHIFQ